MTLSRKNTRVDAVATRLPGGPDTAHQGQVGVSFQARQRGESPHIPAIAHDHSSSPNPRTGQPGCHHTDLTAVHTAPTQHDELTQRQSVRKRCVGVQANSAHRNHMARLLVHSCPPGTDVNGTSATHTQNSGLKRETRALPSRPSAQPRHSTTG